MNEFGKALFSGASAAGMWMCLRYGIRLDIDACTALAVFWGALIYLGLDYGTGINE
jgi:hypothetical protein